MLDALAAFFANSLPLLVWFLLFVVPPLAGWWLFFRLPLGRRRFSRDAVIATPTEAVWRLLDPRGPRGGWRFVDEAPNVAVVSESPLRLALTRRPRLSHRFKRLEIVEEACEADEAAGRLVRDGGGVRTIVELSAEGDRTRVSVSYEKRIRGLFDYERTRLALARDLDALSDTAIGPDARALPLFRFSGWRLALLSALGGSAMVMLVLAAPLGLALSPSGLPPRAVFAAPPELTLLLLGLAGAVTLVFFLLLLAVTLVHETGHALARAAIGRRGITVSLVPLCAFVAPVSCNEAEAFETGLVCLAGPALSALAGFPVMPDPEKLWATISGLSAPAPDYAGAVFVLAGAAFVTITVVFNVSALLPWAGSDGARTLDAVFNPSRARQVAAALLLALLLSETSGATDLLLIGLVLLAMNWLHRWPEASPESMEAPGWRRAALAATLALVLVIHKHEEASLGRLDSHSATTTASTRL